MPKVRLKAINVYSVPRLPGGNEQETFIRWSFFWWCKQLWEAQWINI